MGGADYEKLGHHLFQVDLEEGDGCGVNKPLMETFMHEMGHIFGLSHVKIHTDVMKNGPGGTSGRDPGRFSVNDINRLQATSARMSPEEFDNAKAKFFADPAKTCADLGDFQEQCENESWNTQ